MQAVAINDINLATFNDVASTGRVKDVIGTGCVIVPKKWLEEYADWQIECEAARRLANPSGITYTHDEVMQMFGITQEMLDAVPDEEIE